MTKNLRALLAIAALGLAALPAQAQEVVDFDDEPLVIEGNAENARRMGNFLRIADNSIMDYINESTDSIQQGHRLGYSDFRDWYRARRAEQAEREATERLLASILGSALTTGMDLVFVGSGTFLETVKTLAGAAYDTALDQIGAIDDGDVNMFLDRHERVLEQVITDLEDVPVRFRSEHPEVIEAARWEFVFEATEREARGEATSSEIGPGTRLLLENVGVPQPGAESAGRFRVRVLTRQIYGVYSQDPSIRTSWGESDMRTGAEAAALRHIHPDQPDKYCPVETRLHDFFWSDQCRQWQRQAANRVGGSPAGGPGGGALAPARPAAGSPAGGVQVRREIHQLSAQEIDDLRRGIALMKSRPATTGTSWLYQANIHAVPGAGHNCPATPGRRLPAWDSCQHGQFFFLCWHRAYLYYFERILRQAVREATGDPNRSFALPYWDYARFRELPQPFRVPPASSTNPLFVAERSSDCNRGRTCITPAEASSTVALSRRPYCDCPAGQSCAACVPNLTPLQTFGGEWVAMPHHFLSLYGELEMQPHNVVHNTIGGPSGWMSQAECAARDPIFWLHHANIDRLWQVWLNQGGGRADPTVEPAWRNHPFTFIDADGSQVTTTCCDLLHTANQLGYVYEGLPVNNVNLCTAPPPPRREQPRPTPPERVWTAERPPVVLGPETERVALELDEAAISRLLAAAESEEESLWLVVEGVRRLGQGAVYQLYLNLPEGTATHPEDPRFIGHVALFGEVGEEGADLSFEITEQVRAWAQAGAPEDELAVTFALAGADEADWPAELLSFRGLSILRQAGSGAEGPTVALLPPRAEPPGSGLSASPAG